MKNTPKIEKVTLLCINTRAVLPHILMDNAQGPNTRVMLAPYGEVSAALGNALAEEKPELYVIYDKGNPEHKAIAESPNWQFTPDYLQSEAIKEFGDLTPVEKEFAVQVLEMIDKKGTKNIKVLYGAELKAFKELIKDKDVKALWKKLLEKYKETDVADGSDTSDNDNTGTEAPTEEQIEEKMKLLWTDSNFNIADYPPKEPEALKKLREKAIQELS